MQNWLQVAVPDASLNDRSEVTLLIGGERGVNAPEVANVVSGDLLEERRNHGLAQKSASVY